MTSHLNDDETEVLSLNTKEWPQLIENTPIHNNKQ